MAPTESARSFRIFLLSSPYFGDLTAAGGRGSSTSNSVRGVNFHGIGSYVNTIGFVIIQTTGNEVDFGDNTYKSHGQGSGSTAHGGLS